MEETRQNRIARLLQKELATIFQGQTRMMHGVLVSVTRVRVSPDLSICTAYLSIFPSEKSEELIENINTNEKQIRFELGRRARHQTGTCGGPPGPAHRRPAAQHHQRDRP